MRRYRKRNYRKWIDVILVSFIIALTTTIITISISTHYEFEHTTVSATTNHPLGVEYNSEIPSLIEETGSNIPNIQMLVETSVHSLVPFNLTYPKTPFHSVNEEINRYIKDSKQHYISSLEDQNKLNKVKTLGDLNITSEVYEYKDYYSIVLKTVSTLDRITYNRSYHTIVFNKETGEMIDSKSLLNNDVQHLSLLANYIQSELKHHYYSELNEEQLLNVTATEWDLYNRFIINNQSIVFYYDQGEVAESSAGPIAVSIPISYINPILAPTFMSEQTSDVTIATPKVEKKKVALTFDDGPHPTVTMQILDILEKYNAKATFFMLGKQVENNPAITLEVLNRGHELGNHSYSHPQLTKLSASAVTWELDHTSQAIYDVTGEYPTVFRPPYGATNASVESLTNLPAILWSVDTYDWKHRNPYLLFQTVKANVHDGAIILMHDIHQSTADGLESVLVYLQQEGYECVTVSELLASN